MECHKPVLAAEAVEFLTCCPAGTFVDATVGAGGTATLILTRLSEQGRVIGIDRDAEAIRLAQARLGGDPRFKAAHGNYADIAEILSRMGIDKVEGVLFDLGVSSMQFDTAERGFSFSKPAPLDMRMDQSQTLTAYEIVNRWREEELAAVLWEYGEERLSRQIARRVVERRRESPIAETTELAELVRSVYARRGLRRQRIDPATRAFMSLRLAVNSELEHIEPGLRGAVARLKPGGRLCVITFHSLEDRLVKRFMRAGARGCICPPESPMCVCGKQPELRILTPKPVRPRDEEVEENPRSRSAKLRVAERTQAV